MSEPPLIFSRAALQELDRRAVGEFHIPILVLMENAGRAVAEAALRRTHCAGQAMILAGPGNNGGDGLVAARHLHNAGVKVSILLAAQRESYKDAAAAQSQIIDAMHLNVRQATAKLPELHSWLTTAGPHDLLIDALFGTGLSRPVEGIAADIIGIANESRRDILAVDIPSGLDCDTGRPAGESQGNPGPVIRAAETVSFCGLKKGFANAREFTGEITIADIGGSIRITPSPREPSPPR